MSTGEKKNQDKQLKFALPRTRVLAAVGVLRQNDGSYPRTMANKAPCLGWPLASLFFSILPQKAQRSLSKHICLPDRGFSSSAQTCRKTLKMSMQLLWKQPLRLLIWRRGWGSFFTGLKNESKRDGNFSNPFPHSIEPPLPLKHFPSLIFYYSH